MKPKFLIRLSAVLLIILTVSSVFFSVSAETGADNSYKTYTYWEGISQNSRKAVYGRDMYKVGDILTAKTIGVSPFKKLSDVFSSENGNIFLLDSVGRIIVLDKEYHLIQTINAVNKNGEELNFGGSKSLFVKGNTDIYICDTENARILICDLNGNYIDEYVMPDSPLIPRDYEFKPLHAVLDNRGYFYVLSDGSYYGMFLYDDNKEFLGFYGANEVTTGIVGVFKNIWNRMFVSNTKKSNTARKLPFVFSDVIADKNGFIYTSTGFTSDTNRKGQIKKFSPGTGGNILDSSDVNFTDDEVNITYNDGTPIDQNIIGLDVDENGYIYCLDSAFGKVFMYDRECTMISSFGTGIGQGTLDGTFVTPSAIAVSDTKVFVTDSTKNTLTVFCETDYATMLKAAQNKTLDGEYLECKDDWKEIISSDRNMQLAYKGLARVYLTEGKYKLSMKYAKQGYDRETYALSYEMYRQQWLNDNFAWIFALLIIIIAVAITLAIVLKKKNFVLVKNREVKLLLSVIFHPSQVFTDINEKKSGKIYLCFIMMAVYYVTTILKTLAGGFIFTYYDPKNFNSLLVLIRSVGLVVLFVICNWMVCTLTGGLGKIKDITVITCYSLMPLIVENILQIVLSNVLLSTESEFLGIIHALALIYTFIMLSIGITKIHDYTVGQFVGTGLLTVVSMAAVVFLGIMIVLLVQQLYGFLASVLMEMFL